MAKAQPKDTITIDRKQAEKVRKSVGETWQKILERLKQDLKSLEKDEPVPETLVRNFKIASDQLRRDYRLDPPAVSDQQPEQPASDPLEGLRIVG